MQINIHAIREQRGGVLPVDGTTPCPTLQAAGTTISACDPVMVRGSVTNTGKGFWVEADLATRLVVTCTRCLEPFTYPVQRHLQEMYYPARLQAQQPQGKDVANWFTGDILDLSDAIRDHLQLALPMKFLCREDCKGLCPVCGQNLNEGTCGCDTRTTDSRWASLQALRDTLHNHRP